MAPRSPTGQRRNRRQSNPSLEQQLSLLSWLHNLLGYRDTKQLLDDIGFGLERDSTETGAVTSICCWRRVKICRTV